MVVDTMFICYFVDSDGGIEIFFKKKGLTEKNSF